MTYPSLYLFIDGERIRDREGQPVVDPASEEVLAFLPHATPQDLERALAAAERAGAAWAKTPAHERAQILRRAAELIRARHEALAAVMTLENGKPLAEAKGELLVAAETFEWSAEEARRIYGRIVPARTPGQRNLVLREPVGVVAAFVPWNFPATPLARKVAAALAAGCACIVKPAEETPATALALAEALEEAGLPKGLLNVVFGVPAEVSTRLLASPIVRKVTFTGSTAVGIELARLAAADVKRTTMELGGHAPVVVCDDAELERAVALSAAAKFRNAGQICVSPTRFLVQRPLFEGFVSRLAEAAAALRVGPGLASDSQMGPLANPRRLAAMAALTADAVAAGARLVTGGQRLGNRGFFFAPTVLAEVPAAARIMNEEPFGPVAVVNPFDSLEEALAEANRLRYGLAAYAFTKSAERARQIGDGLRAGAIGINTFTVTLPELPFGGVEHSGDGREGGTEGVESFLTVKAVAHAA